MFATIDIGTNSVLLLIAIPPPPLNVRGGGREGALCILSDQARITRLGEGLHENHLFTPSAIKRTLSVLQEYDTICQQHQVKKIVCVGTAAFRKAKNGEELRREIEKRFGWETKIISGDEEARFSYLSVEHDFGEKYKNLVALDIGGGSTEIISKEGGVSLELGTVVLTERYLKSDPAQQDEIKMLEKAINNHLTPSLSLIRRGWSASGGPGEVTVVALAGTATTLSSVNQKLDRWDPNKIQGSIITCRELDEMISQFRRMTHDALRVTPGMIPGREDTLLAGALILKAVMEKLGVKRVIVSDRGLRYGLFYQEFFDTDSSPS